jgi:hypothetical protein
VVYLSEDFCLPLYIKILKVMFVSVKRIPVTNDNRNIHPFIFSDMHFERPYARYINKAYLLQSAAIVSSRVGSPPQIPKGGISPSSLQNSIEMNTIFIH